ncbi:erythronate-4-phosphate dehydrogenase [Proteus vulgaris]|nr:erythronate-4-phosphate dehydrogenase [Proteus vulgaris]
MVQHKYLKLIVVLLDSLNKLNYQLCCQRRTISTISVQGELTQTLLKQLIHLVYDVRRDDASLRKVAGVKGEFDKLRKTLSCTPRMVFTACDL